jgi:GNAT superfamily N-acetyltransferase
VSHSHPIRRRCLFGQKVTEGRGVIARGILESLPDWFAIPTSVEVYVSEAENLPMLVSRGPDGEVVGFVSLKSNTPAATEVYVMGVKQDWHGRGVGTVLIEAAAQYATGNGARFLTVKTLAPSHDDPHYAATRAFYERAGFLPIEDWLSIWPSRRFSAERRASRPIGVLETRRPRCAAPVRRSP